MDYPPRTTLHGLPQIINQITFTGKKNTKSLPAPTCTIITENSRHFLFTDFLEPVFFMLFGEGSVGSPRIGGQSFLLSRDQTHPGYPGYFLEVEKGPWERGFFPRIRAKQPRSQGLEVERGPWEQGCRAKLKPC